METRSFKSGNGCNVAGLVKERDLRYSCILSHIKSADKSPDEQSEQGDFYCTNIAWTALVPRVAKVIKTIIIFYYLKERSFEKSIESASSIAIELALAVWIITINSYATKVFCIKLSHIAQARERRALYRITICPGRIGLAGALETKLINFNSYKPRYKLFSRMF